MYEREYKCAVYPKRLTIQLKGEVFPGLNLLLASIEADNSYSCNIKIN